MAKRTRLRANGKPVELTFTQAMLTRVTELSKLLFTKEQIQKSMGINYQSWYRAEARDPRIEEAYHRGFHGTIEMAANVLYKGIEKGDKKCAEFFLKTRGRYATESKTTSDVNLQTVHNTELPEKLGADPVEASRIYQQIMMGTL